MRNQNINKMNAIDQVAAGGSPTRVQEIKKFFLTDDSKYSEKLNNLINIYNKAKTLLDRNLTTCVTQENISRFLKFSIRLLNQIYTEAMLDNNNQFTDVNYQIYNSQRSELWKIYQMRLAATDELNEIFANSREMKKPPIPVPPVPPIVLITFPEGNISKNLRYCSYSLYSASILSAAAGTGFAIKGGIHLAEKLVEAGVQSLNTAAACGTASALFAVGGSGISNKINNSTNNSQKSNGK